MKLKFLLLAFYYEATGWLHFIIRQLVFDSISKIFFININILWKKILKNKIPGYFSTTGDLIKITLISLFYKPCKELYGSCNIRIIYFIKIIFFTEVKLPETSL